MPAGGGWPVPWSRELVLFFFQAEDSIRDGRVTGVQTCALPIWNNFLLKLQFEVSDDKDILLANARPANRDKAMQRGEICARHYGTGKPVALEWQDGVITSLRATTKAVANEKWIAPTLVDLQVNGFAGVDFQRDDLTVDPLLT